ncbi:NosD domain-containing protein [Providencia sp. PROV141]|uniref:tail fiber/spike domain-containing protein n=2 Tax=Providencia TaxID=586 RepID=UPI00234ABF49|nr:NosD domain-containing protein [Providencia sp. PROV141]
MREVKPTQKPVPSSDIKDLFFNSGLLDIWATSLEHKYIDRFGNCHLTAAGMEWLFKELVEKFKVDMNTAIVAAGYITIDSFQQGANLPNNELTQRNHILRDETTGEYYRWDGELPKQVPAGSTPESTGGIGKGAWVSVGDASLRSELGRIVKTYRSVSEMKLDAAPKLGDIVSTLSFFPYSYVELDPRPIGGAEYLITNDEPDGHSIILLQNGLSATIITKGQVSLDQLGADKRGESDVTPILNSAKKLGVKIVQSGGSFLIDSDFTLSNGLNIEFEQGAEFVRKSVAKFRAGNNGDVTSLAAMGQWSIGKRTITLAPASYEKIGVGDTLYIKNKEPKNVDFILDFVEKPNDLNDWIYQVQTPIVLSKDGGNVITVSQSAKLTYDFDTTAKISRLDNLVKNAKIKANFRNAIGVKVSLNDPFMSLHAMYGLDISGSKFYLNNESSGIYVTVGRVDSIADTEFHDSISLCLFLRQDCPNSKLIGGKFFNQRGNDSSIFIEAHNYNITVHGNSFETAHWDYARPLISAIQVDAKVNNCSFTSNQVNGYPCGVRLEMGSFSNSVTGNTFQLCEVSGVRLVDTRSNTVTGNTFLDCGLSTNTNPYLSQSQGGVYVNGVHDTQINNNTFTWVNPVFGNFCAALSGSMSHSQFKGNTVTQANRAVWLLANSKYNDISDNPKLQAIGTDNAVLISGNTSHYNRIERNNIICRGTASSTGVVIDSGSEGNSIKDNNIMGATFAVQLLNGTGKYQSIARNHGDFKRSLNVDILAPVMPSYAPVARDFEIYGMAFDTTSGNATKWWQYKQVMEDGKHRWREMSVTSTTVDIA